MVKAILVLFNMKGMDVIVALSAMSVLRQAPEAFATAPCRGQQGFGEDVVT